ncbi:MAG TPA: NAD-dependent succinate-semialdehyde dehydrogenase [Gemmatimonadaceae bacterium]|jgi:succinate-semialdehyde dehydrogenase/glutarate-semialdehyde dehydrogenase|nr:NAD-dependent succinate-semialdehyde dehydrogenase [Gemmatimonadaceae bacterium]HPV74105.1 NAD-dependent succinate-semialdehyde dehydrogenase [Gemmatimonadaceae bacterium]
MSDRTPLTQAFIAGRWSSTSSTFDVVSPATGVHLAAVADCGEAEARVAADASVEAFGGWRQTTAYERAAILTRWNDLILRDEAWLGELMAREMGKPVTEARGEARYAAGFVSYYAGEAIRVHGETIPSQFARKRLLVNARPVGPVYAVTPWNFPAAMITRKAAPALAAGCTMVIKPAEQSPLTALHLGRLWEEAGGPPGTLQILPCRDPIPVSRVLMDDARIRKISFTGSTEVGMLLYAQAARTMKRMSLELGGHAPFIVFGDADVHAAVREVVASKFRNAGQTCVCANRVYVHGSIVDEFTFLLATATEALRVGDPLDPATQVGPLVDEAAVAKVESHVADALVRGAGIVTGGTRLNGRFFSPTVLTGVAPGMRILEEETFGPVAPILSFADDDAVVRAANDTSAGLAAYIWTRDLSRAFRVSEALDYGIVGVNDGVPSTPQAPFGGVKFSGLGREGGHQGIAEYLDVQYVSLGLDA